jgi:hypothetical protein
MASGTADGTIAFEYELSRLLGLAAAAALGHPERLERHAAQNRPVRPRLVSTGRVLTLDRTAQADALEALNTLRCSRS